MKNIITGLLLLLLPVLAFAWSEPYNISKNDTSLVSCSRPCISADENGKAHIVWEAWRTDNYWGPHWIMYASGQDTNWVTPVWLSGDTPSVSSANPNIVIDTTGRLFAGWSDETSNEIKYSYFNGSSWSTPQTIGIGAYGLRMALDKQNNIHAVWHKGDYSIWYSKWNWVGWTTPTNLDPDSSIQMAWPDITIDSQSNINVIVMDYRSSIGCPLAYFKHNGLIWQKMPNPPDTSAGYSCYPRIGIGLNDTVHLVWEERVPIVGQYLSYYSYGKNNIWSAPRRLMDSVHTYEPQVLAMHHKVYCLLNPGVADTGIGIYWTMRDSSGQWLSPLPITTKTYSRAMSMCYDGSLKIYAALMHARYIEYSWDSVDTQGIQSQRPELFSSELPLIELKELIPNPFKRVAQIIYELKIADGVSLTVYNLNGQLVKSYDLGHQTPGLHTATVKMDSLPSGVYFCQLKLKSNRFATALKKMVVIR